jgi:hypothetical protein
MDLKADKVISLLEKMNLSKRGTKSIKIGGLQGWNGAGEKTNEGRGSRIIVRENMVLAEGSGVQGSRGKLVPLHLSARIRRAGDFNKILFHHEKEGASHVPRFV